MVRPLTTSLSWLAVTTAPFFASAIDTAADTNPAAVNKLGASTFILECAGSQELGSVLETIEARGGELRHRFNSAIFRGLSIQMKNVTADSSPKEWIEKIPGVENVWETYASTEAITSSPPQTPDSGAGQRKQDAGKPGSSIHRRADGQRAEPPWNLVATHVDELHEKGFKGSGFKIAVIDSGVDYTHPALGGCLGKDCRVAKGDNFVKSDGKPGDPMDCLGHGTQVASVVAANDPEDRVRGAAPDATIHAYRIIGCKAVLHHDDAMAGWLKAVEDGADIIVTSAGLQAMGWSEGPLALVTSRVAAQGIPAISFLGNYRNESLFSPSEPSSGRGVLAVNSLRRSRATQTQAAAYTIDGGAPVEFRINVSPQNRWGTDELDVHDFDKELGELGVSNDDGSCPLDQDDDKDLDLQGKTAIINALSNVRNCTLDDKVTNAVVRGALNFLVTHDPNGRVEILSDWKSNTAWLTSDLSVADAVTTAIKEGKQVKMRGLRKKTYDVTNMAGLSTYGPTWDLDIKPQVSAPGEDILVANMGGGFGLVTGTSFAAPLVAGIYAVVAEARGLRAPLDPAFMERLMVATAKPQMGNNEPDSDDQGSPYLYSVAQQGGGMVNAWDAAQQTTLVKPTSLNFNETKYRVPSISLELENTADVEVVYQISAVPAATMYTLGEDRLHRAPEQFVDAKAVVKLSKTALRLAPGQSGTVEVSASDPEGVDPRRLPIWSGWISINGTDGFTQTVPYLGLAGSLRDAVAVDPSTPLVDGSAFLLPGVEAGTPTNATTMNINLILEIGSPEVRVHVVPLDVCPSSEHTGDSSRQSSQPDSGKSCVPANLVSQDGELKTIGQVNGYPKMWQGHANFPVIWDGKLNSGQYAPPGRYRIVAKVLSIQGDASKDSDWQTIESSTFSIAYSKSPAGDEKKLKASPSPNAAPKPEPTEEPADPTEDLEFPDVGLEIDPSVLEDYDSAWEIDPDEAPRNE
ncbi:hypothetical protein HIM_05789 [Hirsutella minnesotensis 3608]|uniref:Peptidase S8/S53 domain-containing protein n=1 Tax=Hirsutella minnesotensis 3608 TaxID=1043627 RepID=A0A0F7ZP49_9HYPO|nr:hypothetical protein HIM_05789 [Hirsutella minnesotensis 3608]